MVDHSTVVAWTMVDHSTVVGTQVMGIMAKPSQRILVLYIIFNTLINDLTKTLLTLYV